ncbi:MAG: hypothetical protein D6791_02795, partial [Chloroflexi bacterium]
MDDLLLAGSKWMPSLSILTALVNLLYMIAALWLGLYLVTRSPRSQLAWLAAITVWFLGVFFARNSLVVYFPRSMALRRLQPLGLLGLPFWFHLTVLLRDEGIGRGPVLSRRRYRRFILVPIYGLASLIIAYNVLVPGPLPNPDHPPVYVEGRISHSTNLFMIGYLVVVAPLTFYNLWQAWAQARDRKRRRLLASMVITAASSLPAALFLTLAHWRIPTFPVLPGDAVIGVAMMLFGYQVARYRALIEGYTIERDALYTMAGSAVVATLYGLVTLALFLSGHASFLALVVILVCATITHGLYDTGRTVLDRLFYHEQFYQLRSNLRALAREAGAGKELSDHLQATLSGLCRALCISKGIIALREDDSFSVRATEGAYRLGQIFPLVALETADTLDLPRPGMAVFQDMALLVPLIAGGKQIGVMVLGEKASGQSYSDEDTDFLDDLADQIATILLAWRMQEDNAQAINTLVAEFRERERVLQQQIRQLKAEKEPEPWDVLGGMTETEFVVLVEECLRRLDDFSYLGDHALAQLRLVDCHIEVIVIDKHRLPRIVKTHRLSVSALLC